MSFHTVYPSAIAATVGGITIHWYGLIIASAIGLGFIVGLRYAKKKQVGTNHVYNLFFLLLIFGLIGARLWHVLGTWPYYREHPGDIVAIWNGGIGIFGALLAGIVVVVIYARVTRVSFWRLFDVIVFTIPLMQAIGRWGNYFNQELFGKPTNMPWGIPIDSVHRPVVFMDRQYFHPLFLYESILLLLLFGVLLTVSRKQKLQPGRLTLLYFVGYGTIRFSLEFLRIDEPMLGLLSVTQWICLLMIISAMAVWLTLRRQQSRVEGHFDPL